MTTEQIKEAIEAEALKAIPYMNVFGEPCGKADDAFPQQRDAYERGMTDAIPQLSAWGYVKVPETDEELKDMIHKSMYRSSIPFIEERVSYPDAVEIAQAYAAKAARDALIEEQERLIKQRKSMRELVDKMKPEHDDQPSRITRLNGKIQGVNLAIENIRQSLLKYGNEK